MSRRATASTVIAMPPGVRRRDTVESALARAGTTASDAALAVVVTALLAVELGSDTYPSPLVGALLVLPIGLVLAWRRRQPVTVALVVCGGDVVASATSSGDYPPQMLLIPLVLALYTAAAHTNGRRAAVTGTVTLALVFTAHVVGPDGDPADFLPWLVWGGPWFAGRVVRRRSLEAAAVATAAVERLHRSQAEAREAAARERDRIARELHDVVAHAVSLVVVQAGAERLRLGGAPETAATTQALDAIETAGRQALVELRAMLAVLRSPDQPAEPLGPQPGLAELPALVDRVRTAGLPVTLDADLGRPVAAGVALSAYRIVQEALTNALKHGNRSASVSIGCVDDSLAIEVRSRLGKAADAESGTGRGLVGMRERVALHGGRFETEPGRDCWVVRAQLPLAAALESR